MSKRIKYYLIIVGIIAADQILKYMVSAKMELNESIALIDGIIHITYIRNTGAAFSILQDQRWILVILPILVAVVGMIYLTRHARRGNALMLTSISMIIGGGIGNAIDRAVKGYVTDFLDFQIWPIFNFADVCVCVGCALLGVYIIFLDKG